MDHTDSQRFEMTMEMRIPLYFMSILRMEKKIHPIQKEGRKLVKLESGLCETNKSGKQTGEEESRNIK